MSAHSWVSLAAFVLFSALAIPYAWKTSTRSEAVCFTVFLASQAAILAFVVWLALTR